MKRRNSFCSETSDGSASSRVSFSDDVSTQYIDEPCESRLSWYSLYELQEIRRDANVVVSVMRSKTITQDTDVICTHGLDSQVNRKLARARKQLALSAVLYEQDYQIQETHDIDDELLADVYIQATRFNQLSALQRGRKHAKEVQSMWTREDESTSGLQHTTKNVCSI